tara:strand:+ start:5826 stop:6812 length:987 start_codon:yes stop_codon:yes gene_type:complete
MIIISRCPYRVSLLGGSSDLDWYVNQSGYGIAIGFAIKLYSRVVVTYRESSDKGILNYSSREEYRDIDAISHPIIRACLNRFNITNKLELSSFGGSLQGSGLGSSSSFSVALVKAITKLNTLKLNNSEVAHHASEIEISDLKKLIGRQDQYLCALGGVNVLEFKPNGIVNNCNQNNIKTAVERFSKNLYLVNTAISRSATKKLSDLKNDMNTVSFINDIRQIAISFLEKSKSLNQNDIEELLGIYLLDSWRIKRKMFGVMNKELLDIETKILKSEFKVLKLLGAGGGGYFLVSYNGNMLSNAKSELQKYGLMLTKIEICNEGCSSLSF